LITIFLLAALQTTTFALSSRARNRDHFKFAFIATILGNTTWFLCFREMDAVNWDLTFITPYVLGAAVGGDIGMRLSMVLEKKLSASSDRHLGES
jgi:uncharacterized membrane protein YfcA